MAWGEVCQTIAATNWIIMSAFLTATTKLAARRGNIQPAKGNIMYHTAESDGNERNLPMRGHGSSQGELGAAQQHGNSHTSCHTP